MSGGFGRQGQDQGLQWPLFTLDKRMLPEGTIYLWVVDRIEWTRALLPSHTLPSPRESVGKRGQDVVVDE